jgi:hypothetical protein
VCSVGRVDSALVQSEQGYSASYRLMLVVEDSKKFCFLVTWSDKKKRHIYRQIVKKCNAIRLSCDSRL